jgi:2-keto-4-pentenoate hydratase/2-oxohepta-3-ene-1,7-dioic acid hydratase in catechol pathway
MKPETALLRNNAPFYRPDFTNDLQCGVSLVLRVCRLGRSIAERFAPRYYDAIGIGIDFAAGDLLRRCVAKGLAWECCRAFDGSAPCSAQFLPVETFPNLHSISFSLSRNGSEVQSANTADMTWDFNKIIAYVSQFVMLKMGDLIFAGAPAYISVDIGDTLVASIEGREMVCTEIK